MITLTGKFNHGILPNTKLFISENAARELAKILKANNAPALRIGVKGGGCSGMGYVIQLEKQPHSTDTVFEGQIVVGESVLDFALVIDPKGIIFIEGTEIDWEVTNLSPRFVFKNPNAKSACSCGLSFDPKIGT
jgi:iron-sulfur cluster assembly protein